MSKIILDIKHKVSNESGVKNEVKVCSFKFVLELYERIIYVLWNYNINLIAKPTALLKELVHRN